MKINCFHSGFVVLFSLAIGLFLGSQIGISIPKTVTPSLIQSVVKIYNPILTESQSLQIAYSLDSWIEGRNLNLMTSLAVVAHESRFNPEAIGPTNDKGLWQLNEKALEELERRYGVSIDRSRLYEVDYNCRWGTLYFRLCAILAKGDREEAIARYHCTTDWWKANRYVKKVTAERKKIVDILFTIDK